MLGHDVNAAGERPATIYDVAREAGVSHQTVARFLNGEKLKPLNHERVGRALAELDYRPNDAARNLATNRSLRVGALASDLHERGPQVQVNGAVEAARESGYVLDIISVQDQDPVSLANAVKTLSRMRMAGLIVVAPSDAMLEHIKRAKITCPVEFEIDEERINLHPYLPLMDHLIALGHRRFVHLAGPAGWRSARGRTAAYRLGIEEHGLVNVGEAAGDWTARSGYAALAELDDRVGLRRSGVTAVASANDSMALGAIYWLTEHGFDVPGDVSVVGFDGVPDGEFFHPPLTSVWMDGGALGRNVFNRLLARIDPSFTAPPSQESHRLVVRASAAPPPFQAAP